MANLKPSTSSLRPMISMAVIAALSFSSAVSQTPSPQQPQASKSGQGLYRLRVESELVLVNVVVRDKQGNPVAGLTRDDFTLLEDGKAQRVSSFDFENLDTTPLTAASGPSQSSTNVPAAKIKPILTAKDADEALSNKRVIVLLFDLSSMGPDETERSVQAAKKYVQTKMTSADLIAIVSLASSLRLDQDFTTDQARLLHVLNRFSRSEGQGMDNGSTGDADGIEETGDAYTPSTRSPRRSSAARTDRPRPRGATWPTRSTSC